MPIIPNINPHVKYSQLKMDSRQYSIYPNTYWRIGLHLLFWTIVFLQLYALQYSELYLTKSNFSVDDIKFVNNLPFLALAIGNHYALSYLLLSPDRTHNKVWMQAILLSLSYLLVTLLANVVFHFLPQCSPENQYLKKIVELTDRHWTTLFSRDAFRVSLNFVLLYNVESLGLKLAIDYYETEQDRRRIQQEQNEIEIALLRTKIRPNFLLKHLEELQQSAAAHPQASKALERLSHLMQFSLYETRKPHIPLAEEVAFLQDYIALERLRHREERVDLRFDYPKVLSNSLIKPLILINLIENAFKHGLNKSTGKAYVHVCLQEEQGVLRFSVSNSKPQQLREEAGILGGIGLSNLQRRLVLEYPEQHSLHIQEDQESYEAKLRITLQPAS